MKIYANALALSILLALLAACGDESSSSVSPEPRQCEEQSDDCDNVSSSSEKISKNSSSSQKSTDKGKSSSSEKNAKESSSSTTTKNSSSSVGGDKSSSSVKKEDSSSSAVKASSSSVTPKSSSSEEVKQSSSSIVASSSSVKSSSSVSPKSSSSIVKVEHFSTSHSYAEFEDVRNHHVYKYLTVSGENVDGQKETIKVMAENLNIGELVDGSKDQSDDSKIERYCYDNDTVVCLTYGGLYQWAEMMQLPSRCNTESCADLIKPNHQGICPDGWRLLTVDDFYIVLHADGNRHGVEDVRAMGFGGYNYSGYSLIGGGLREGDDGLFYKLNSAAFWYFPIEQESRVNRAGSGSTNSSTTTFSQGYNSKNDGFSVRCVMVE